MDLPGRDPGERILAVKPKHRNRRSHVGFSLHGHAGGIGLCGYRSLVVGPGGPEGALFRALFVADDSDPKRFGGRVGTVARRCTRTVYARSPGTQVVRYKTNE